MNLFKSIGSQRVDKREVMELLEKSVKPALKYSKPPIIVALLVWVV